MDGQINLLGDVQDFDTCSLPPPAVYYMGPEHHHATMKNSGVLYMNASAMWEARAGLLAFQAARGWDYAGVDQVTVLEILQPHQLRLALILIGLLHGVPSQHIEPDD